MCGDGVGMGNNAAGTGGDGDRWEKNHAGTGGDGVSVDFAGRGWGHISVPMQLSIAAANAGQQRVLSGRRATSKSPLLTVLIPRINSILCVKCLKWVYKRCSGIKGKLTSNVDFRRRRSLKEGLVGTVLQRG